MSRSNYNHPACAWSVKQLNKRKTACEGRCKLDATGSWATRGFRNFSAACIV